MINEETTVETNGWEAKNYWALDTTRPFDEDDRNSSREKQKSSHNKVNKGKVQRAAITPQ